MFKRMMKVGLGLALAVFLQAWGAGVYSVAANPPKPPAVIPVDVPLITTSGPLSSVDRMDMDVTGDVARPLTRSAAGLCTRRSRLVASSAAKRYRPHAAGCLQNPSSIAFFPPGPALHGYHTVEERRHPFCRRQ